MLVTLLGMVEFMQPAINVLLSLSMIALQLSLESYLALLGATTIDVKLEQLRKATSPMLVTPLPMTTEVKLEQLAKAELPMLVTLLGISTEVKLEQ